MIELRWIVTGDKRNLQYRERPICMSNGAIIAATDWTDWKEVEHYYEPYDELKS